MEESPSTGRPQGHVFPATGVPRDTASALTCAVALLHAILPALAADKFRVIPPKYGGNQSLIYPPTARAFIDLPTVQRLDICIVDNAVTPTDGWHFALRCWPADILQQARRFWPAVDITRLAALPHGTKGPGGPWIVNPCPHLSFIRSHLVFCEQMHVGSLTDYLTFWHTHPKDMRQYKRREGRTDFGLLLDVLSQIHPLSPTGLQHFALHFTHKRLQTATLNPGLYMGFELPTDEALALDQKALLGTQVRTKIQAAFALWGEGWPSHPTA